ncbi:MAG TPA: helix-turn-helix domain-containing protein [Acidimicrobiales bacterium]|jgi:AcrR family transcriptional regulator|nr:helix-turn-helix domain-containing protein [Acidimicrobiales bacterium]
MSTQTESTGDRTEAQAAHEIEGAGERPMRADARRNRELLVTAARNVFSAQGGAASMEAIAKEAGVGVGTLYRHFPNRLDLVEAVYQTDVQELWDTAQRVGAELEPWPAVEAFFDAFLRYARTKKTLLDELHLAFEKKPDLRSRARALLESSFDLVIDRAKQSGAVRDDISGSDVMQLVSPVCTNASIEPEQAGRLLRMILDGLRADAARTVLA